MDCILRPTALPLTNAVPLVLSVAVVASSLLASRSAVAQPNPFEDYEQGQSALPPAPSAAPKKPGPAGPGSSKTPPQSAPEEEPRVQAAYRSEQLTWGLGGALQLGYNGSNHESLSGAESSVQSLMFGMAPRGSLFVIDNLELSLAAGYLATLADGNGFDANSTHNFFFEVGGSYHIPIAATGLAWAPGLGLGGYFGSSHRSSVDSAGADLDVSGSTASFLITGHLLMAYQLSDAIRIRSGVDITGAIGSESVDDRGERLSSSRAYIGLPLEVTYVF